MRFSSTLIILITLLPIEFRACVFVSWNYQSEKDLDGSGHWGLMATYSGAGYVQNLASSNKSASLTIIDDLWENLWLDLGTRAVFVDFTVYNANVNLFCVVRQV